MMARPRTKTEPAACYLNVDLEIRSRTDLKPLVDALSGALFVLHAGKVRGEFFLSLNAPGCPRPDAAIGEMAEALLTAPTSVRKSGGRHATASSTSASKARLAASHSPWGFERRRCM